jgi:hypothetical protein
MSEATGSANSSAGSADVVSAPSENAQGSDVVENREAPKSEAPPPLKKKYKLKVDGEDVEEEIDFNDEEGMRNRLQLARAAKKRMAEAQADKKKAFDIIQAFESDPQSMLKRMGPKGREIAEKYLLSQIEEEMLTPEQRELKTLKQENETFKQREAREKEEAAQKVAQQKEYEYAQNFQSTIIEAIEKAGLKKSPLLVKRMASLMAKNLEFGLELTADDLAAEVKGEVSTDLKDIVSSLDGDQLIALFGPEIANKIRKSDLKRLQEKQGLVFQNGKKSIESPAPKQGRDYMTLDEWRENLDKKF